MLFWKTHGQPSRLEGDGHSFGARGQISPDHRDPDQNLPKAMDARENIGPSGEEGES